MANWCSLDTHVKMPDAARLVAVMDNEDGEFQWDDPDNPGYVFSILVDVAEAEEGGAHVFGEIKWRMDYDEAASFVRLLADEYGATSCVIDYWEEGEREFGSYVWDGKELVDRHGNPDLWDADSDDDWDAKWEKVMSDVTCKHVADIEAKMPG